MVSAQSTAGFSLFDSVPEDYFHFGVGNSFQPKVVPEVLGLKREDVSKLASVSLKSVRYDDSIPEPMRERLEEIAITINMVIRLGRFERLRKFIINAVLDKNRTHVQEPEMA